jgi:hypothetical protein
MIFRNISTTFWTDTSGIVANSAKPLGMPTVEALCSGSTGKPIAWRGPASQEVKAKTNAAGYEATSDRTSSIHTKINHSDFPMQLKLESQFNSQFSSLNLEQGRDFQFGSQVLGNYVSNLNSSFTYYLKISRSCCKTLAAVVR